MEKGKNDVKNNLQETSTELVSILYQTKLNIAETAEALCMSRTTFNKLRKAGQLPPSIKIAEREFWLEGDLEQWIVDQMWTDKIELNNTK